MTDDDVATNGAEVMFSSGSAVTLPPGFFTPTDNEVTMIFVELEASSSLFPVSEEGSPFSTVSAVVGFSIAGQSIAGQSTVDLNKNITIELDIQIVSWQY